MSSDASDRLTALFQAARERPPDERAAFLNAACNDPALRAEVETLLAADARADARDFLGAPIAETPQDPAGPDLTGSTVGPFTVERLLGAGGMGDVYLATRAAPFHQTIALKVLRRSVDREEMRQRFAVERQILASLDHPGIARLLDGGISEDGQPYFAMELVEGKPLTRYCDERKLGIQARLRLFTQVCEAVHFAHQNLIVHRDLKPSNVLVAQSDAGAPTVKLLDFGIAKLLSPDALPIAPVQTRTLDRVLTPEYASPEQIRGEPVTTATDIYALGVLLYELLVGRRPYHLTGYTAGELERTIIETPPDPPSTRAVRDDTLERPDGTTRTVESAAASAARSTTPEGLRRMLRGDLDSIALKALRKDPQARYASAEGLAADVERYLTGQPVAARRGTRLYRARKYIQRHRVGIAAAALVLVALVGGLGAALWQARAAEAARAETQRALDETEIALGRAEAVTEFLQSLFEANDYMEADGDTLDSMELLALGAERAQELADEPEVQAQVLQTIGLTYFAVDETERADSLLRQALAIRTATLGPRHPDVAETMFALGSRLALAGAFGEAEPLLRQAVEIEHASFPAPRLHLARYLSSLGSLLRITAQYDEAKAVLQESVAMARQLPDSQVKREIVSGNLSRLGMVNRLLGEMETAEALLREALAATRTLYGDRHVQTSTALSDLAGVLIRMEDREGAERTNQLEEAEALAREALSISRERLGEDHHHVAIDLGVLAHVLWKQGDLDRAEALYLDSVERHRETLGKDAPHLGPLLYHLSQVYQEQEAYAEAETALRESLAVTCTAFGVSHAHVGRVQQALADLYATWGRSAASTECPS